MSRLLSGYRVVESGALLNSASIGMLLADLGADVIKLESPFLGDYLRAHNDQTYLHHQANKSKRSVALDLRKPEGKRAAYALISTADAFVTNAVADRNDRIGLGYEQLREVNPSIVYCQHTGYGAVGPYAEVPTHGQMMDALAGATPVEMCEDGFVRPAVGKHQPRIGSLQMAGEGTMMGALFGALHVAAALAGRAVNGEGAYIDVAASAAVVASAWPSAVRGDGARRPEHPGLARYQYYQTSDEHFVLFCPEERKFWETFCHIVGRSDLRPEVYGEPLRHEIQSIIGSRTLDEWLTIAREHRLPIGPAHRDISEVVDDPQMRSRQIFVDPPFPAPGIARLVGSPALVAGQPYEVVRPAPELGEHTDEILAELGYAPTDLQSMRTSFVTSAEHGPDLGHITEVNGQPHPPAG
ncbi:MAG: CoA transferase [Ilumatobacteraceae bacterium]